MRFRGGGVGHKSTRRATDKFLKDRDDLDLRRAAQSAARAQEEAQQEDAQEEDDDIAVTEAGGDEEEEDDYGYRENELAAKLGDDSGSESEDEDDIADDALGAEDGEGAEDETAALGFAEL
jgi:hypothetical protein